MNKKIKLFISHAGEDKEYIKLIIELLEGIGLGEKDIFCSSMPGYGVPLNGNIYDYLAEEFKSNNLIVVYALSEKYYGSAACLNEMGAAWVLKREYISILLPGFEFKKIDGAIDPRKIGIKLDSESTELKHRLNELKDFLVSVFSLIDISETKWERYRDKFISEVQQRAAQMV